MALANNLFYDVYKRLSLVYIVEIIYANLYLDKNEIGG